MCDVLTVMPLPASSTSMEMQEMDFVPICASLMTPLRYCRSSLFVTLSSLTLPRSMPKVL